MGESGLARTRDALPGTRWRRFAILTCGVKANDWYALVGTSMGGVGQALLFRSKDLRSWAYLHPLVPQYAAPICEDTGQIWECPNLFELDGAHVLLVSRWHGTALTYPNAFVGTYVRGQFHPDRRQRLDWGYRCYYAPLSLRDEQGRRLVWGWLQEQRHVESANGTWAGVASLPRHLTLEDGVLRQRFVPELQALREGPDRCGWWTSSLLAAASDVRIDDRWPRRFELRVTIERGDAATLSGLRLRHSETDHTDVTDGLALGTADRRHAPGQGTVRRRLCRRHRSAH
jgi:beta-fructofuranosidase